jgi:hypothetical protein
MVQEALNQLRAARIRTVEAIAGLSQVQMDYVAAPGKWSVGEVVDHVLLIEAFNRDNIVQVIGLQKAGKRPVVVNSIAQVNATFAYMPRFMLPFMQAPLTVFNMVTPNPIRKFLIENPLIPLQHPDLATPRHGCLVAELRAALDKAIAGTNAVFAANPDLDFGRMIVQQPLLGRNTVPELVEFLASHETRHQVQINDVLQRPDFPA